MTKQRTIYFGLIIVLILVVLAGVFLLYRWNKPLGPSLGLPTRTAVEAEESNPFSSSGEAGGEPASDPAQGVSEEAQAGSEGQQISGQEPVCGGPVLMNILLIGSDYRGDGYLYGLADAIRVVRVDFTIPAVAVLDFPRDLWVEIPGISDHYDLTHGKLNQAYFFGSSGMGYYDGPGEGPGLLARTLDLNFNLPVDHYLTINMQTLVEIVDAVGGVDITFDTGADLNAVVGPTYPELVFAPGTYHFDGELALHLITSRKPSTFQRTRNQNMLIFALRDKLLSPEILPLLPFLVARFSGEFQTDLSPSDINKLICAAQKVSDENTRFAAFPEELFTPGRIYDPYRKVNTNIYEVDFEVLRTYVAQFLNGTWPAP